MKAHESDHHNDNEAKNPLIFTCARCGGNTLDLVYDCLTAVQEVSEVYDNGDVYVTGPIEILEDHGHWYRCHDCGKPLSEDDTDIYIWKDDSLFVQWLLDNCEQEDTELSEGELTRE